MMCDNQYNHPWYNTYKHYLEQHAIMSNFFQQLHSNMYYANPASIYAHPANEYVNSANAYNCINYNSRPLYSYDCPHACSECCCSASSSECCSSESSCSSSGESEESEMDNEERYDEEQYQGEDYEEDESECEYELNVDAILAMRAAKEELRKQEMLEEQNKKLSDSNESSDEESSYSKYSSKESKNGSIVMVDSDDKEDFEYIESEEEFNLIDSCRAKILDFKYYEDTKLMNKVEEKRMKKHLMQMSYGKKAREISKLEKKILKKFNKCYDNLQPQLWPVLPLRMSSC